jgi:hypothetical protein
MATDYLGNTISTGDRYGVAGIVRAISGDDVVVVLNGGTALHVEDADLVPIVEDGFFPISASGVNWGTGKAAVAMKHNGNIMTEGGGSPFTVGRNFSVLGASVYLVHNTGTGLDPWSLQIRRDGAVVGELDVEPDPGNAFTANTQTIMLGTALSFDPDSHRTLGLTFVKGSSVNLNYILTTVVLICRRTS